MSQELKVIIIDDDRMSSHNWNILLKFIGEDPLMLNGENWLRVLTKLDEDSQVFCIMIGSLMESQFNSKALTDLIKSIHQWNVGVPILLNSSQEELEDLPESSLTLIHELPEQSDYKNLLQALKQARQTCGIENPSLTSNLISETGTAMFRSLVGQSELMQATRDLMHKVAEKNVNVLVLGESGTGKEIMARNLHYHSGRGEKPFVIVNCASLSNDIFGQAEGHNGTNETKHSIFEKADGGTLFLDEVADIESSIQAKLVRFLETQSFERLGSTETIHTNIRIVASTNQNLKDKITQGLFREDLYYRLSGMPITVPALREHVEDIPELVGELISRLEHGTEKSVRFNSSAMLSLQHHHWPGNVRELASLVERLSIIQTNEVVGVSDLPLEYQYETEEGEGERGGEGASVEILTEDKSKIQKQGSQSPVLAEGAIESPKVKTLEPLNAENLKEYLRNFERHLIQVAIDDSAGLLNFAAERLDVDREELDKKMEAHELLLNVTD